MECKIEGLVNEPINRIGITREAFEKMNFYARIVSETIGKHVECAGRMLNFDDKHDDITRDIYLSEEQDVAENEGMPREGPMLLESILKENKKISGVWHSHGNITTYPSQDDDKHSEKAYRSVASYNKLVVQKIRVKPKIKEEDKGLKIRSGSMIVGYKDGILTISGKRSSSILEIKINGKIKDISEEQLEGKCFINNVIINKDSYEDEKPDGMEGFYGECLIGETQANFKRIRNLEIELVEEENGIEKGYSELIKECGERVRYNGVYLKDHKNYNFVLGKYKKAQTYNNTLNGYRQKLRDFYTKHKIDTREDNVLVDIAKILAGDFEVNGKKIWKWDDRIKEVASQLESVGIPKEKNHYIKNIYGIVRENRYLRKKFPKKIRKLKELASKEEIKYRMGNGCIHAGMGILTVMALAMDSLQKASLYCLSKTRPDIAEMIKQGKHYSEIIKQYNKNARQ